MIRYIEKGDIFHLDGMRNYAHGCNCADAGLGGLKWNDVKAVLDKVSNDYPNVDLYVVETYQSG